MTFTPYQKFLVAMLAFLQFTIILDFMIISPMGALLMPALKITPTQFGVVVSAYAFSAATSGFLAAGFADRFDRKKLLLFFYIGFILGTLLCGIADTYEFLLFARMVTGFFGGVVGSVVFAITTDLFAFEIRGRVMGYVQTAFAASQVLGIPAGLFFSNLWGWHAPFLMIVAIGSVVGVLIFTRLQPVNAHLKSKVDHNAFHHLFTTVSKPHYILAFVTTALMSTGGFMLMPFGSAFAVHNLQIPMEKLPFLYLTTGLCALIAGPLVGRFSDRAGKLPIFVAGSLISLIIVLIYTRFGPTPLWLLNITMAVMFAGMTARMIPSQALMSAIPDPKSRGAFMSVSSSLQQVAGGLAAVLAGSIVREGADGNLIHFEVLGYVVALSIFATIALMFFIDRHVKEIRQAQAAV